VSRISNAAVLGSGDTDLEVADDGSYVDIEYAFRDTADTGSVTVAEVTVQGVSDGSTGIDLAAAPGNDGVLLFDEGGIGYDVTGTSGASITVEGASLPPVGDFANPPNDPDGDGLYEDVNGDEEFDIVDVQAMFASRESSTIQDRPEKFDVNGDGTFDVVDVQALFNDLQEGSK
jgi:PKD repeat protein